MSKKQILEEVNRYIDYLEKPNENFGDMPVCPFLKPERLSDKIMIRVWRPVVNSLNHLFQDFLISFL